MYQKQLVSLLGMTDMQTHEPGGHRDGAGDGHDAIIAVVQCR